MLIPTLILASIYSPLIALADRITVRIRKETILLDAGEEIFLPYHKWQRPIDSVETFCSNRASERRAEWEREASIVRVSHSHKTLVTRCIAAVLPLAIKAQDDLADL